MPDPLATAIVLDEVAAERTRQEELVARGKFTATCAGEMSDEHRFLVLAEEYAEVTVLVAARAFDATTDPRYLEKLRAELIQVAAVAVAWVEGIDQIDQDDAEDDDA